MTYLGHVVSEEGMQTNLKKVEAIQKWPIPTNVTEAHSFLGFTNYYCKFIKQYAQVAKPLNFGKNVARKQSSIKLNQECQEGFDKLELCTSAPI